jgi:hypothetical protein
VAAENRPVLDAAALASLTHPVRLDLLGYLMSSGPATASYCARAVGDTPSNCSYHLRILARHGLVEPAESASGRERPWRATITGFDVDDADPQSAVATAAAMLELDHQLAREHLRRRDRLPAEWRRVDQHSSYGLRVTPDELTDIVTRIDAIVRPYLAPTRDDAPDGAAVAHLAVTAFVRPEFP